MSGKRIKIHVVPCLAIFNKEGKVLLMKRASNKRNGGKWEIPGGSLRFGESPRRGALREVKEETGFKLNPLSVVPVDTFGVVYPELKVEFIIPLYATVVEGREPVLRPEEHEDWGWFPVNQVKRMEFREEAMKGIYTMVMAAMRALKDRGLL